MKFYLDKILNDTISKEELNEFNDWLKDKQNQIELENYIRLQHDVNLALLKLNKSESYRKVLEKIGPIEKPRKVIPFYQKNILKYAAAILILVSCGYYFFSKSQFIDSPSVPAVTKTQQILPGSNKARLTLENGEEIVLDEGIEIQEQNFVGNGQRISYNKEQSLNKETVYNYLTIPRGGQYQLQLADGTQVWLNSESKLKYPVSFVANQTRSVELLYGEAYFDVSPSSDHAGTRFVVHNAHQNIEVVGTEFNVRAYDNDDSVYTTLVEGLVSLHNNLRIVDLTPNKQAILKIDSGDITIKTVDVYDEISWKNGVFSFKDKTLKSIMDVLSRWYDIDVVFESQSLETELFGGSFDKNQNINFILEMIETTNAVKFDIQQNEIIVKSI